MRTPGSPQPLRWRVFALALLMAVLCACASSTAGQTPTSTAPLPTSTLPKQQGFPDSSNPMRWGYNTSRSTGKRDPPLQYTALPPGYRIETAATGLDRPTSIGFLPDGRILVTQHTGAIRVIENGTLLDKPFFVTDTYFPAEREDVVELGLVGLAVDPEFASNGYVYVYYTTSKPHRRTVLARLVYVDGRVRLDKEILSLDAAPPCCHIAGSLRFAPDGSLFVDIGDHQIEPEAQKRGSPYGSILRIDRNGKAKPDNPFANDPAADPRVYAYGLRNPFDLTIDPVSHRIFATENGFVGQDAIIEVKPGANYGWPGYNLAVPLEQIEQPLLFFNEAIGPAGIQFYRGTALPALDGSLLFCQFHNGGALHVVTFKLDGSVDSDNVMALGCTSDLITGPDGFVYFLDYVGGTVYRIARGG